MLAGILGAVGGLAGAYAQRENAKDQAKLQKEFAQQGIRWKVEDAKAAGIHPLYALGANTVSYSPVSIGDVGTSLASAGQDLGRAMNATRTPEERTDAYTGSLQALQLERGKLENELLRSQLRRAEAPGTGPGIQGDKIQPPQQTSHLSLGDGRVIMPSGSSDQQAFEDRFGEVVGELYGMRNYWREVLKPGHDYWVSRRVPAADRHLYGY